MSNMNKGSRVRHIKWQSIGTVQRRRGEFCYVVWDDIAWLEDEIHVNDLEAV